MDKHSGEGDISYCVFSIFPCFSVDIKSYQKINIWKLAIFKPYTCEHLEERGWSVISEVTYWKPDEEKTTAEYDYHLHELLGFSIIWWNWGNI